MDFKRIKEEINNMFKNKYVNNILIAIIILVLVFLAISVFKPKEKIGTRGESEVSSKANDEMTEGSKTVEKGYEEEQKKELTKILRKIDGIGEIDVMMTFESGEVKVPAYDKDTQVSTTEEEDTNGGKRVQEQKNDGSRIVMKSDGNSNDPFIIQTNKPKVLGVVVVAEGAENTKTKYDIEKAVSNLYNLSFDKVMVYPMGS